MSTVVSEKCIHCGMDASQAEKPGYTACLAKMRYYFNLGHEFWPPDAEEQEKQP